MECLHAGIAIKPSGLNRIAGRRREGPRSVELAAGKQLLQRGEGELRQQHLGRSVADTEVRLPHRVLLQTVAIRSLDAVHAARVFGLRAIEEPRGRSAIRRWQKV